MAEKKSSKKGWIIGITIIVLAGAGITAYLMKDKLFGQKKDEKKDDEKGSGASVTNNTSSASVVAPKVQPAPPVVVAGKQYAYTKGSRLYDSYTTNSPTNLTLPAKWKVQVIGTHGDWSRIDAGSGINGWTLTQFLDII